jgi:predicted DNA-binding transcriptional regulator AlpA
MGVQAAKKFLSMTEVCAEIGVCRWTLTRWVKAGLFPQPSRLGNPRAPRLRWSADEVEQFMRARQGGGAA